MKYINNNIILYNKILNNYINNENIIFNVL